MVSSVAGNSIFYKPQETNKAVTPFFFDFLPTDTANDIWYGLKDLFCTPTALGEKMRSYAAQLDLSTEAKRTEFKKDLVAAFQSEEFPQLNHFLGKALMKMISTPEVNSLLNEVMEELFKVYACDPEPLISKFKGLFTLEKIERVVHSRFGTFNLTEEDKTKYGSVTDKLIQEEAGVYRPILTEIEEGAHTILLNTISIYFINTFDFFVNMFLRLFQLKDFFEEDNFLGLNSDLVAEAKYRALRDNIGYLGSFLAALSLYTGDPIFTVAAATATALVAVITAYIYFKYIKPCPEQLRPFKNLVTDASKGIIEDVYGRDKEIDQLEDILCSNDSSLRKHAILLGPTGVGKTEIVKGLAIRIAKGTCRPELKNKKLFTVNTTQLNSGNFLGEMYNLERVKRKIAGYEAEAIFFFDEIHEAFKGDAKLGNNLKTEIMDPGANAFPYCIFATTENEYDQYIRYDSEKNTGDQAFERRISPIHVLPNTPENTCAILSNMMTKSAPHVIIDNKAIEVLSELTTLDFGKTQLSQPCTSKGILSKAMSMASHPSLKVDETIQDLKNKRDLLMAKKANDVGDHFAKEAIERRADINKMNDEIAVKINDKKALIEELEKFHTLVKERINHKKAVNKASVQLDNAMKAGQRSDERSMEFLMNYHFVQQALSQKIDEEEKALKAKHPELLLRIDEALIQQLIQEERSKKHHKKH